MRRLIAPALVTFTLVMLLFSTLGDVGIIAATESESESE